MQHISLGFTHQSTEFSAIQGSLEACGISVSDVQALKKTVSRQRYFLEAVQGENQLEIVVDLFPQEGLLDLQVVFKGEE